MGSMAIEACDSQYASSFSFGVSVRKLSACVWMKPVLPTRSTSELKLFTGLPGVFGFFAADSGVCASIETDMKRDKMSAPTHTFKLASTMAYFWTIGLRMVNEGQHTLKCRGGGPSSQG